VDSPVPPHAHTSPLTSCSHIQPVAGGGRWGCRDGYLINDLAAVEVLDTDNHQWLSASSLPVKCSHVTTAILQDELYLVGGTLNKTLVANLPDIIHSSTSATTKPWRTLPAPPLERSAAITIHGALLAVGGCHDNERSTAIHVYQPATNIWSKVGDLPCPISHCACTLLRSGGLLVAAVNHAWVDIVYRDSPREVRILHDLAYDLASLNIDKLTHKCSYCHYTSLICIGKKKV